MSKYRLIALLTILSMLLTLAPLAMAAPALSQVNVAGSFESEIGGSGDWLNNDPATNLTDANSDGVWKFDAVVPAGAYEYKIVEDGDWSKAYPANNVPFTLAADQTVKWYYDPTDHYVADNVNQVIAVAVGSFQSEAGAAGDWMPDNLKTLLKGPNGEGKYTFLAKALPAGNYEYKVALNESWDVNYGANGDPGGANLPLAVPAGGSDVLFTYDPVTHIISAEVQSSEPPPPPALLVTFPGSYPEAAGLGGNWAPDNLNTQATDTNNDGVWKFVTNAIPPGSYEFKATVGGSWTENYGVNGVPGGANVPFTVATAGQQVHLYYDRSDNYVASRPNSRIVVLVGSLMSAAGGADWAPDNLKGWMKDKDANGVYEITLTLPAGSYEYKVAVNESWDENYGAGGAPGGANIGLVVPAGGGAVTFTFNDTTKEIRDTINNPTEPGIDGDIWWDGLGHDSRDPLYRTPFGAVTMGTEIRLRFRTTAGDVEAVGVRVADVFGGGASTYRMTKIATMPSDDNVWGYDIWEATFTAPDHLTVLQYVFGAVDGDRIVYYGDDAAADGGWGAASNSNQITPFDIYVYDPAYSVPDWAKNATIYQIFPDRFRNGDETNDPTAADWFYPAERGHAWPIAPWNTIVPDPEPNVPENPWHMTYSSTFYGGDLQGVLDKLDYLQSLGVTAIYFNPIFDSPSNHRYDGRDYRTIAPSLGDLALFNLLDQETEARGMKLILDLVPNHVSSDSIYFDRFGRHPEVGACESVDSPYRDWFYFTPANPPGTGVCAGDANYEAWFGVVTLPKVNTTNNDAVREFWMRADDAAAKYWLRQGADGYRVDVANEIHPSFFQEWRPILRTEDPEVQTYSETWNESDVRPMVLGNKFDSTMNYRFATALLSFLRDTPFSDGDGNLNLNPLEPSKFESALRGIQEDYPEPAWESAMNLLDSHDTNRAVVKLDHDGITGTGANRTPVNGFEDGKARLKTVAILQFTLPGAPTVYYGDEVGLAGFGSDVPRDDPYNRQPYPWADEPGYDALPDWRKADADLLAHYQAMGQIRAQYSFLRTGSWDTLLTDDAHDALAYARQNTEGVAVVVVNRAKTGQTIDVPVDGYLPNGLTFTDALNGGTVTVTDGTLTVTLNGLWGAVLVHEGEVVRPPAPANLRAVEDEGAVRLTWQAVPGATGYRVYRSYVSGGGYALLAEVTGTQYTDTDVVNSQTYYYVVRAVVDGLESENSNEVSAIPHLNLAGLLIEEPLVITHTIAAGQPTEPIYARVRVKFESEKPGALEGVILQVGYGLPGTLPGTWDTWQPMTFVKDYNDSPDQMLREWEQWTGVLYPDQLGEFTFLVRASTTGGRDWAYSGFHLGVTNGGTLIVVPSDDTTAPAAPTNLHVTGTTPDSISLAWDANTEPDLYGYEVYRRRLCGVPIGTWHAIATVTTGTAYVDRDVSTGCNYEYYIVAVDMAYNRSTASNHVEAVAEARMVQVTFNVTVPDFTPETDTVYLPGTLPEMGPWNPSLLAMTKTGANTWSATLEILDGTRLEYKYTRGSWDTVEWWEEIYELLNRVLTVDYGTDGTTIVNDTVPNWRDPLVVSSNPADGATGVPVSAALSVTFSRPIKPDSLAGKVTLTTNNTTVAGAVTYDDATKTVTFSPSAALLGGTTYTLTVGPNIMSDADGPMQDPYIVTFTTAGQRVQVLFLPLVYR